ILGSGFANVVRGYIEPGDPTDQALHIGDWMANSTGNINSSAIREQVEAHIDLGRTLRLPIWNNTAGFGITGRYQASQFGIFRLIGYNLTSGWLLLEFIDHDTSCGQLPISPSSISLDGPADGTIDVSYSFTATTNPANTTSPITYTWEITDQDTITSSGGISNIIVLEWASPGSKTITVTADNGRGSPVSQSHIINITGSKLYLPYIAK
ncbi:MAG: hypothetical protein GY805_06340, partial [Chloroflexi bacterium]|nr:hypothetical protein [Chloroflexota bacterium]